ncbi:MAG: response regulator transcription factor [Chloroflexi bacterium]|nr:response regulator transcription factor [Chloroflexota bacterium]
MAIQLPSVMIVSDEPVMARALGLHLERDGFDVTLAGSGGKALKSLEQKVPDVVVVDLWLRDDDGFAVSRRVKQHRDVPVIMLAAVSAGDAPWEDLATYADEYLVKPFYYRDLRARIQRMLHRVGDFCTDGQTPEGSRRLHIDVAKRAVTVGGRATRLTHTEARLLAPLCRNPNRPVPTAALVDAAWPHGDGNPARLWVSIQRIRKKLEPQPRLPQYLVTVPRQGYKLVVAED